jgi:hypothetical protein
MENLKKPISFIESILAAVIFIAYVYAIWCLLVIPFTVARAILVAGLTSHAHAGIVAAPPKTSQ